LRDRGPVPRVSPEGRRGPGGRRPGLRRRHALGAMGSADRPPALSREADHARSSDRAGGVPPLCLPRRRNGPSSPRPEGPAAGLLRRRARLRGRPGPSGRGLEPSGGGARGRRRRGPHRRRVLKTALGFLGGAASDYEARLSRMRWSRAIPAPAMELDPRAVASAALASAESWVLVRRPSALPAGRTGEVPVPPPGRALLVAGRAAADPFPQTWRELQDARVRPCPGAASEAPALAVRTSEFPPGPEETVDRFVDRLLADAESHAWAEDFAAI